MLTQLAGGKRFIETVQADISSGCAACFLLNQAPDTDFYVNLSLDQRMLPNLELEKGLRSSKRSLQLSWLSKSIFWANGALQYPNPLI
jgi:hypothetical protein